MTEETRSAEIIRAMEAMEQINSELMDEVTELKEQIRISRMTPDRRYSALMKELRGLRESKSEGDKPDKITAPKNRSRSGFNVVRPFGPRTDPR